MPIPLITERNMSEGLQVLFVYANDVTTGIFINLFIFAIFVVITFGIFFAKKRNEGDGNFPACMATGGFITAVTTILLGLIPGLINTFTYVIVIVVALASILFFLFSRD